MSLKKLIKEEFDNITKQPKLCELNIEMVINNFDENIFGRFQDNIDNKTFNPKLSKSLCLNDEIIGGYLLGKSSILEEIKLVLYWFKKDKLKNLKFFVGKEDLNKYKNKRGIFSNFIYIDPKYRSSNYGNILINYSKTLGDYVWGLSVPNESTEYWIEKQNRVKILEYNNSNGKVVLTATQI